MFGKFRGLAHAPGRNSRKRIPVTNHRHRAMRVGGWRPLSTYTSTHSLSPRTGLVAIFLDIDGVVFYNPMDGTVHRRVTERFKGREHELRVPYSSEECDRAAVDLFSKSALRNLDQLIGDIHKKSQFKAGVVLSSAWRLNRTLPELKRLFQQHAFSHHLIAKTPTIVCEPRSAEVARWLSENQRLYDVRNFVVLDDCDSGFSREFPEHFVACNHRKLFGQAEYERALSIALKLNCNATTDAACISNR